MEVTVFQVLLISTFFLISCAQIPIVGKCPEKRPLSHVDIRKFSGHWFEVERTSSLAEWPYKCISLNIQPFFEHKSTITVTAIHRYTGKLERHSIPLSNPGSSEGKDGKVLVNMTDVTSYGIHKSEIPVQIPVQILASDPECKIWGIAWSCQHFPPLKLHTETVWVLTRKRVVEEAEWLEIREKLRSLNLENYVTRETVQKDCGLEDQSNEDER